MSKTVDIANRKQFNSLLLKLHAATVPLWGKMNARQMIEHLIDQVEYTNGKKITGCFNTPEKAALEKTKWIYTDAQIPKNLVLKAPPENFRFTDLETAKKQLLQELDDFNEYFKPQGTVSIHASYGAMNYNEWLIWHNKHFTHHFKQFGLLPED